MQINKSVIEKIKAVLSSMKIPGLKFRKGNHEGAVSGVIAGLALLGGSIASTFDSSFQSLLGNYANYVTDFLAMLGFIALVGGIVEYRKLKH